MEKELRILEVKNGKLIGDKSMGEFKPEDDQLVVGLPKKEEPADEVVEDDDVEEVEEEAKFENFDYGVETIQTRHQHEELGEVLVKFNPNNEDNTIEIFGYKIGDYQEGFSKNSPLFIIELTEDQKDLSVEDFDALITEHVVDYAKEHYIDQ